MYSIEYRILVPLMLIRFVFDQFYQINFANYQNMEDFKRFIRLVHDSFHFAAKLPDENINEAIKIC